MVVLTLTRAIRAGCTLALGLVFVLAAPAALAHAAGPKPATATQEYDLKAAFLFNFARFVEWPGESFSSATAPITIGVLGTDPFGRSLDEIVANEEVGGRRLVVRRYASIEQVEGCHILFISASEEARLGPVLARLGKRSVLTVGDVRGFADRAGMIGFETAKSRLRLRINLAAVRAARLTISSQLLRQATIVAGKGTP